MTLLTAAERQLLLEVAFAGVNHGLLHQVRAMLPALPFLVADKDTRAVCQAVLLVGLNEPEQARCALEGVALPEAQIVRQCFSLM